MCFCFSIPKNVQEWQMSMTYRSLLAFEVGDVPLVVHRCYRLRVAPRAMGLSSRSFFGCAPLESLDYYNRWQNHCTYHCSTITITSTYEVVADAVIFRSHFIRHKTIKTMGELENTKHWKHNSRLWRESYIKKTMFKKFHSLHKRSRK